MFDLDAALHHVIEAEGADLHLKVGSRPMVRAHGRLEPIEGSEPLRAEDTERVFSAMLTDEAKLGEFRAEHEVDFSYAVAGLSRFRVNAFRQRGAISIVCRAIPYQIKSVEELLLPPVISDLAEEERGIILLTGTTGSGKSTTLAAMIDQINAREQKHIVTIEDPLECLHPDRRSVVNQREVEDTIVSQRLVPTPDGRGRVAVWEVLRMTGRVRDMIVNPDETGRLPTAIAEGAYYGMRTFDQALLEHVQAGREHGRRPAGRHAPARLQAACGLGRAAIDLFEQVLP